MDYENGELQSIFMLHPTLDVNSSLTACLHTSCWGAHKVKSRFFHLEIFLQACFSNWPEASNFQITAHWEICKRSLEKRSVFVFNEMYWLTTWRQLVSLALCWNRNGTSSLTIIKWAVTKQAQRRSRIAKWSHYLRFLANLVTNRLPRVGGLASSCCYYAEINSFRWDFDNLLTFSDPPWVRSFNTDILGNSLKVASMSKR